MDPAAVKVAAAALDEICRVAASEAPRSATELQFGIMEENRALRALVVSLHETVSSLAGQVFDLVKEKEGSRKRVGEGSGGRGKKRKVVEEETEERREGSFVPLYGDTESLDLDEEN
jgi:hypothetical protein